MSTTVVTIAYPQPAGAFKVAVFDIAIGAGDTTATIPAGFNNVYFAGFEPDSAEDNGQVVVNSNNGTEGSAMGTVYISGLANSTTGKLIVFGV